MFQLLHNTFPRFLPSQLDSQGNSLPVRFCSAAAAKLNELFPVLRDVNNRGELVNNLFDAGGNDWPSGGHVLKDFGWIYEFRRFVSHKWDQADVKTPGILG
jgi:hypothetical protein